MADAHPIGFQAGLQIEAAAPSGKGPRRFQMTAYNGGELLVRGYRLPVVVDLAGLSPRTPAIPIYSGHASGEDGERLVGHADAFDTTGGKLVVRGAVSAATRCADEVLRAHDAGFPWQCSIGALPMAEDMLDVPAGQVVNVNGRQFTGPIIVARRAVLRHIAVLPEGADPDTSLSIAASAAKGNHTMADNANQTTTTTPIQATDAERVRTLWASATWNHPDNGPRERAEKAMILASQGQMPYADFERIVLQERLRDSEMHKILASLPQGPAIRSSSRDAQGPVIEAALARAAGLSNLEKRFKPEVLEASDSLGSLGLQEVLIQAAYQNGYSGGRHRIDSGNISEVMRHAFAPGIQASSTYSLPGMLSNVANKFILDGFDQVEQTWRAIAGIRPARDFKTMTLYRLTDDLEYDEIGPGGEIHHGTLGEESYTMQAKTYAKMLGITRTDIINDDLGAFDTLRNRLGRGAGLKLNSIFWTAFLDDATFFTEARGNLITTALDTDPDCLDAAIAAFQSLTDGNGHPLGIQPSILLVPPALGATAKRLYVSGEFRDTTSDTGYVTANPHQNMYKPAISAYLSSTAITGYSATGWYLLADPAIMPVAEVCFLDGRQAPTIETSEADFATLGVQFRGYHDFGVALAEWRAGVKSTGLGS